MNDHKAEAEDWVRGLEDAVEREGQTDATLIVSPLIAQVYATLYLAEQQKRVADELHTANLIGSLELIFPEEIISDTPWGSGTLDSEKRAARTHAVLGQIREGLGLS